MPRDPNPAGRHWFLTIYWNDTCRIEEVDRVLDLAGTPTSQLAFAAWQFEIGTGTKHLHIQATIHCRAPMRLNAVQDYLGAGKCFCERVKDDDAAEAYCNKPETAVAGPFKRGVPQYQGKRNDHTAARDILARTRSTAELSDEQLMSFLQYHRAWNEWLNGHPPPPATPPRRFIVHWGVAGSGKSFACREYAHHHYLERECLEITGGNHGLWFDGAMDPKCLLIEDFRGESNCNVQLLKLLTDSSGKPTAVDTKHGRTWLRPQTILISSEADPRTWYPPAEWPGIQRRITRLQYWPTPRAEEPERDVFVGWARDQPDEEPLGSSSRPVPI